MSKQLNLACVQMNVAYYVALEVQATQFLIGFKAICIHLVGEVFVFPILHSPHDVALINRPGVAGAVL